MTAVRILRLAAGGEGVGRLEDGRTVFVPRTAPGDLVEIGGLRARRRYARARVARVLEPSPDRVEAEPAEAAKPAEPLRSPARPRHGRALPR